MDVRALYQQLLSLPKPWRVVKVVLADEPRVDVWLEHPPGIVFACPECQRGYPVYDHSQERAWRHLDTCQAQTWIHAALPRVHCPVHGVRQVIAPLADGQARLTVAMESRAILTLRECSGQGSVRLTGLSWDELKGVMSRAVARGLLRRPPELPEVLGIDEKSVFARHRYFTIIAAPRTGQVLEVINQRSKEALEPWFEAQREPLKAVKAIAMDMSAGFAGLARRYLPGADICFDHFHVTQIVQRALDEVRKAEQRDLPPEVNRETFFRRRFLFLYNQENVPAHRQAEFAELRRHAVKTSKAWAIKECLRELWHCPDMTTATAHFKQWYWWATHSRLKPMNKAAHTLKDHWDGIANALRHRLSNACSEGLNNKIEQIKRAAYGFRSIGNFRTAILFHCGGLDLNP